MASTAPARRARCGRAYSRSLRNSGVTSSSYAESSAGLTAESMWVHRMPSPGIADDGVDLRSRRAPSEVGPDPFRRGIEHSGIAWTPRGRSPCHRTSGHTLDRCNHFLHRGRVPSADVVSARRTAARQPGKRAQVCVREIDDMKVVAQTRTVRRRIVLTEDVERCALASRFERARYHVNLGGMVFTELSVGIGAGGVEVSEADRSN